MTKTKNIYRALLLINVLMLIIVICSDNSFVLTCIGIGLLVLTFFMGRKIEVTPSRIKRMEWGKNFIEVAGYELLLFGAAGFYFMFKLYSTNDYEWYYLFILNLFVFSGVSVKFTPKNNTN